MEACGADGGLHASRELTCSAAREASEGSRELASSSSSVVSICARVLVKQVK